MLKHTTKATRRIQFCAGHRIYKHESKCKNFHGHNYVVFIEAVNVDADLDSLGRVIDFSVLKERVGGWIEKHWDHGFIHFKDDAQAMMALAVLEMNHKTYVLDKNPTAENMARHLLEEVCPVVLEGTGVTVTKVTVWETENCFAEAR